MGAAYSDCICADPLSDIEEDALPTDYRPPINQTKKETHSSPTLDDLFRLCQDRKEEEGLTMVQDNPHLITTLTPRDGNGLLIFVTSHQMEELAIKILKLNSQISLLERGDNKYHSYHYAQKHKMNKLIDFWKSSHPNCKLEN